MLGAKQLVSPIIYRFLSEALDFNNFCTLLYFLEKLPVMVLSIFFRLKPQNGVGTKVICTFIVLDYFSVHFLNPGMLGAK